jgi:hypothetical protein
VRRGEARWNKQADRDLILSAIGTSAQTGVAVRWLTLILGPLLAALLSVAASGAVHGSVLISINKATQRMSVFVDGVPLYDWPVSTGAPGYSTPTGSFRPFRMERDHFSEEWDNAPMPYSIFFTPQGHAIHGSYQTKHLGTAASHGCVRIAPAKAAILFALVSLEGLSSTQVTVMGNDPAMANALRPSLAVSKTYAQGNQVRSPSPKWPRYYQPPPPLAYDQPLNLLPDGWQ